MAEWEDKREQVSWNIAADQARHVSGLIKKGIDYYLSGEIGKWFWVLTALREIVNYDLKGPERDELDDIEKDAKRYLVYWEKYSLLLEQGIPPKEQLKKIVSHFSNVVRKYQRKLLDLLNTLGYFPSKEDRTELSF
jgi:hypothetical protein